MRPKNLTHRQREDIMIYCLRKLAPLIRRRAALFGGFEDLVDEVGIHIWIALLRYKNRPYNEAVRLAYVTGRNRLTSLVRSILTVQRKGHHIKFTPLEAIAPTIVHNDGLSSLATLEFLELLLTVAICIVGQGKAEFLLKALLQDWSRRTRTTAEHEVIMNGLGKPRREVTRDILRLHKALRKALITENKPGANKTEGVWRAEVQA